MIYLTVNDAPSGVFKSQVVDVVIEMNSFLEEDIKLVVLLSFRNFKENKAKIQSWYPKAVVKKMIPGLSNWKKNRIILSFIKGIKKGKIIARGPMAYELASSLNENVIYDGRGAVKAELEEFPSMIPDKNIVASIIQAEKNAVETAIFKIAVSEKLVTYWRDTYSYKGDNHIIIPCTLSSDRSNDSNHGDTILHKYGWKSSDIILVYSGSLAGWQSFDKVNGLLGNKLKEENIKVLFLSQECQEINNLQEKFPTQVKREWLDHAQVADYLAIGDYGILIRDENKTNLVASPVKFAEYLSAGLKVLISPNLGDFSQLVVQDELGIVIEHEIPLVQKVEDSERQRIKKYSIDNFSKNALKGKFETLANF